LIKQNRGPVFWEAGGLSADPKSCGKADDDCVYREPTDDYSSVTPFTDMYAVSRFKH
jgi:hypothetical protein